MQKDKIQIYKTENGKEILVKVDKESLWLDAHLIASLFNVKRPAVVKHIQNIYKSEELIEKATCSKMEQVAADGKRRKMNQYNLDVIISVGYRVNSKQATQFRQWATKRLKDHLIKGYTINEELLQKQQQNLIELQSQMDMLNQKAMDEKKTLTEGFLSIISKYSRSFELLSKYDSDSLSTENLNKNVIYTINYDDVKKAVAGLKKDLIEKGEAGKLFGNEKDDSFKGILGSISQTVFGELAYPTIEEQAAQLLYSIIKGHSFSDGTSA
ncbi:MAG TPA: RhuM family protein [Flavobacteriaceae bacterium]|nr:RhuM family protein [Flavobacteriaceae bacterium]